MSKTPATAALSAAKVPHTVHSYDHDAMQVRRGLGYGAEAAEALGVEPGRVFKTLVASVDGQLMVAVIPVLAHLDLKALATAAGGKRAQMADPAIAQKSSGYVVGGISPLGQRRKLRTVVDATVHDHATVFVSAGRRGLDVELAPGDLVALTRATTADISAGLP